MQKKIRQQIEALAETDYRIFSSGLLPHTEHVLGVRLPLLRKIAKQLSKSDWRTYLQTAQDASFEEIMLQGMVIGCVKCSPEERFLYIQTFVPKIDNWSVCDSFCTGLKFTRECPTQMWDFLQPYLTSNQEFYIRFAVIMLIFYYINESYIVEVIHQLDRVQHSGYYVKMAVAWAISVCYIQFPEITLQYLQKNCLDDFTYHKALQKIMESLKVDKETKKQIRTLKRESIKIIKKRKE
ncbi:MAG: DNA alkylation repair protein [Megasphaera sp.]|jgi:3-methyladenine DNA glycosylase AlkD|uniref:DNA alkylation repair protein n=1 Tax=Megasphaera sueciensis TaxID=349094 RepID=UPI003D0718B5|nr:DNA alkylation repair protein [Megasphaera sp.]MCI1823368.1 DNA alkylation repair protein [Megasphaera sp.]